MKRLVYAVVVVVAWSASAGTASAQYNSPVGSWAATGGTGSYSISGNYSVPQGYTFWGVYSEYTNMANSPYVAQSSGWLNAGMGTFNGTVNVAAGTYGVRPALILKKTQDGLFYTFYPNGVQYTLVFVK
jgi:hypothetical protein